tara:strand:+ start:1173 stop:1310 length:138 start_codon:yes stop_codon:yes gene_type:complete
MIMCELDTALVIAGLGTGMAITATVFVWIYHRQDKKNAKAIKELK